MDSITLTKDEVDLLIKKMSIFNDPIRLRGHGYAWSIRNLFLENRLQLTKVEDHRSWKHPDSEVDLSSKSSISTYDELVVATLNTDQSVELEIWEATESFKPHPSRRRATFYLTGDWWAISSNRNSVVDRVNAKFANFVARMVQLEEERRLLDRGIQIEAALLDGSYVAPSVED